MLKLSQKAFEEIKTWMYRNARPLELARWQYHFENGNAENVTRFLEAYQNADGGFGNTLEPDSWNPESSPYSSLVAVDSIRELGIYDPRHPVVERIFSFLDSGKYFSETGWLFTIPSNSNYPHAPWWTYSEENNIQNGYHVTGGLVGYILRCGDKESSLYRKALSVADNMTDKLRRAENHDVHEIGAYCSLVRDILSAELTGRFDCAYLVNEIRALVNSAIERDPEKWPFYSMRPSNYIDSPESVFYAGNEEIFQKELDYILASRHDGGVWDISWRWEEYPAEFAISRRWWQGFWAIRNLLTLKTFGRVDV
jgi:hypothetical protein